MLNLIALEKGFNRNQICLKFVIAVRTVQRLNALLHQQAREYE